jgi:hypothetical protein
MITVTAWENAEAPKQMLRAGSYAGVMQHFFGPSVAREGFTTVWEPVRINSMWSRCPDAGRWWITKPVAAAASAARRALPAPPPYW